MSVIDVNVLLENYSDYASGYYLNVDFVVKVSSYSIIDVAEMISHLRDCVYCHGSIVMAKHVTYVSANFVYLRYIVLKGPI